MTDTATPPVAAEPSAVALEVFTDEELAILGGPDRVVVTPYLNGVTDLEREAALRTAYRGLLARGILDPPPAGRSENGNASTDLPVRQDVHALVTLRRGARAIVAIARSTASSQDFWYAHVVDDVCLLEEVSSDGLHRFALLQTDDLAVAVTEAAVHPQAGDGTGDPVTVATTENLTPPQLLLDRLGASLLRADVVLRTAGDDGGLLLGVFSGPAGSWVMRARRGSGEELSARPLAAAALRTELRAAIEDTLEQMRAVEAAGGSTQATS